jgi:ATP-dependent exoDNAse (exonuclease V) beta subunit
MLSQKNPHQRDDRIVFREDTHTYLVDGTCDGIISVTTFIHHFFPNFDANRVVKRMKDKKEKYPGLKDDEIIKKWSEDGKKSAQKGTTLHKAIELFYENLSSVSNDSNTIEFRYFLDFHDTIKERLTPYRTEWSIFDGEIDLAGQLDMLYKKDDGTYALYDWKCVKEIKKVNQYEKGFGLCSDLDHCNFYHYSLQLHIYKRILETRYDMTISEMKLVVLHQQNPTFVLYDVADMSSHVEKMFSERHQKINHT